MGDVDVGGDGEFVVVEVEWCVECLGDCVG